MSAHKCNVYNTRNVNNNSRHNYELTGMYMLNTGDSTNNHNNNNNNNDNIYSNSSNVVMDIIDKHFSIHHMIRDFNESMPVVVLPSNFEMKKGMVISSDAESRLLETHHQQDHNRSIRDDYDSCDNGMYDHNNDEIDNDNGS